MSELNYHRLSPLFDREVIERTYRIVVETSIRFQIDDLPGRVWPPDEDLKLMAEGDIPTLISEDGYKVHEIALIEEIVAYREEK